MKNLVITRRQALQQVGLAASACAFGTTAFPGAAQTPPPPAATPAGPYQLPPLPYPVDALEPYLDARTMEIHHGKHHAAYVQNLNKAVAEFPALTDKPVEVLLRDLLAIPEKIRTVVRNHGGGHANHALFWPLLKKNEGGQPKGALAKAMEAQFGSFDTFKQEFTKAALGVFGSGWAWLTVDAAGMRLETTPNQDTPLSYARTPILALDIWEHAYYLKYQNRRADYIAAFFNVIDWDRVADLYGNVRK
jgi:Fe-Mn family superoxide dismutase